MIRAALLLLLLAAPAVAALPGDQPRLPAPPGDQERVPSKLAPAIDALRKGNTERAQSLARDFVKANPASALGHEVLGEAAMRRSQWREAEHAFAEAVRLEPSRITATLRLGLVALATRNPRKAEEHFTRVITTVPSVAAAHHGLAIALGHQGKRHAAIQAALQGAKVAGDDNVAIKTTLAGLYYESGRLLEAEAVLHEALAVQAEHLGAQLLLGIVSFDLGRTDEAAALFEHVVAREPRSLWARLGRALVLRTRGQLPQARTELEKLIKEQPDWSIARMELGRTLLMQQDLAAALRTFDAAERAAADDGQTQLRNARLLLIAGYAGESVKRVQPLMTDPAMAVAARDIVVRAHVQQQQPEQAEKVLRAAIDASPQDPVAKLQLGRFYLARSQPRDALVEFERALTLQPDAAEARRGQAEAHAALRDADAAVSAADKFARARGETPDAAMFVALIQQRVGRTHDAVQTLRTSLTRHTGHLPTLRTLAAMYERDGQPAEAVKALQDASNAHPKSAAPLTDLGAMLQRRGRSDAAISAYRDALRRAPEDPTALNNLAYLLAKQPAGLEEAAKLGERAYKKVPRNPAVADTYGWILVQQGAAQRGLPLLEHAARQQPNNQTIRYHLGAAYARTGKREDARKALEAALQGPAFDDADAARKLLESLR
jgi:cellulose synthase operon protein C